MYVTNIMGIEFAVILGRFIHSQGRVYQFELAVFLHILQDLEPKITL